MCVWQVLNWMYPDTTPGIGYNIFFFALIVVALFWVQFLAMYAAGQDKIRAQEETIAQHQAHMALLEELQQEIRAFRHDFTNLFSGLTLQAQEGDVEGIQDFMKKTSSYFDEKLGQEIQQMDGLNNIRLYPLRSLLTTKLADMRKKGIHSALEVLYPVDTKVVMETEDLLRAQHQAHMALLEELQQEIRAFRHDFTNLFSGLTLQAQEGDVEGIQDFMKKTSSYFDEKLGQEIQQMDGLNNIRLYPLRSLLTTKLADMRKKGIHSALEVLYPVDTKVVMETEDLLRGLGILIDNAMEAVPQTDGTVRIVLLQEEKELYIAVSNNYEKKPELSALSQKGYTTKGTGRGTGLTSYRRIVSRCKGCITRTYLKDGYFVQELRLPAA